MSHPSTPAPLDWDDLLVARARPHDKAYEVVREGALLLVRETPSSELTRWQIHQGREPSLVWSGGSARPPGGAEVMAALEGFFTFTPTAERCTLSGAEAWPQRLLATGVLLQAGATVQASRDLLWQQSSLWLPRVAPPFPLQYQLSHGRRHPRRSPKPEGQLYQRHIPWLNQTFSFRSFDLEADLPTFHRWMNDPEVDKVWQEAGDLDKHRRYLEELAADPHIYPMVACFDGHPFAYFEAYWAKENRIGPFCEADDYDRGWHVLVGEPAFRGKRFAVAWLTSISHYLFLDDPRTQRVVGEPRADHAQQIRNLDHSGYAKVKEFHFPHKRALLVSLLRERYFADALWWPRVDTPSSAEPRS